ncbi:MAG: hypothetical protein LBK27_00655 [Treponema sp.]|jgi:uncharacterized protein YgiM (DUF1202 family)|nr:hypothetical protein [Treponema sp.]
MKRFMKQYAVFFIFILWTGGSAGAQMIRGGTVYAAAKTIALKSSTGFFARTQGTLAYGDRVTVIQIKGKWAEVRSAARSSLSGWTASSNLTAKRVVPGSSSTATNQEVALAGKGFSEEVENAYKADGNLNYADVDKTEAIIVSEQDLYQFLKDGHLSLGE